MLDASFRKNNRERATDIGEGVAGQVAELSVVHQVLQQRLSEEVSGTSPQSLTSGGSMSAPCRPVTGKVLDSPRHSSML